MTTTRIPLVAQINVTIVSQAVTAAYGSAGDLVNYSAACSSVLLRNPGEVWPIEFKVGSGAWQRLEIYNTTLLGISLDTTTIRVRKASANSGSGLVQLDIRGLASTYLAGDDAVDLGGEGGADSRLPETITPKAVLFGADDGEAFALSEVFTYDSVVRELTMQPPDATQNTFFTMFAQQDGWSGVGDGYPYVGLFSTFAGVELSAAFATDKGASLKADATGPELQVSNADFPLKLTNMAVDAATGASPDTIEVETNGYSVAKALKVRIGVNVYYIPLHGPV